MSRHSMQMSFTGKGLRRPDDQFGGALLKGNPKRARPIDRKLPLHLVLRATEGRLRRPAVYGKVSRSVYDTADKYGVKIFRCANVGNHLHLVIRVSNTKLWPAFIRELTGRIAVIVGLAGGSGRFWLHRPFTRIVRGWKKAFRSLLDYVELNRLEAEGYIKRSETKSLRELRFLFGGSS